MVIQEEFAKCSTAETSDKCTVCPESCFSRPNPAKKEGDANGKRFLCQIRQERKEALTVGVPLLGVGTVIWLERGT